MAAQRGGWRDPLPEDLTFYQIPFRCLVQERVPNLTLPGRRLDADKVAYSAVRVMVDMDQTGEAAGVACALALENDSAVGDLNPQLLRAELTAGGSIVL